MTKNKTPKRIRNEHAQHLRWCLRELLIAIDELEQGMNREEDVRQLNGEILGTLDLITSPTGIEL